MDYRDKSKDMIEHFVNCLGLDGKYYVSTMNRVPMHFAEIEDCAMYLIPETRLLSDYLQDKIIDDKTLEIINDRGLIVINDFYIETLIRSDIDPLEKMDFYVSIIHEMIHSNRTILLNTQYNFGNIPGIFYTNHFIVNKSNKKPYIADVSQNIVKASVDTSQQEYRRNLLKSVLFDEIIEDSDEKFVIKLKQQRSIDETLVEVMAIIAYNLYDEKEIDIMMVLDYLRDRFKDEKCKAITNIILRHNDLELFRWMIDPLTYQIDDVNYDFFGKYLTKEDEEDYQILIKLNDKGNTLSRKRK